MSKKILSRKQIIKDQGYATVITFSSFFFLVGLAVQLSPFLYWEGDLKVLLPNMILMSVLSIPFCYIIGIRNIAEVVKHTAAIKTGKFYIEQYIATSKHHYAQDIKYHNNCQIIFKNQAKNKRQGVWYSRKEAKQVNIGDRYYIFYLQQNNKQKFYTLYENKKYELDADLKQFLKDME